MKEKVKQVEIVEHLLPLDEVCKKFETNVNQGKPADSQGLTPEKIQKAKEVYGPNTLSPAKRKHPIVRFLECLGNLFNVLLVLAGIMTFVIFGIDTVDNFSSSYIGAILVGVALLNALIEFIQLQKSANALESFLNMIPQQCRAVRGGSLTQIAGADLVPGDIVFVQAASMILLDDNFASTVRGIEEGRLIFVNLKKSIRYTITHTLPEVIPQLLYIIVPIPLLLNPLQILSIDLGFELCLALTFAWDKPESKTGLMKLPPRKPVTEASVERFRRIKAAEIQPTIDPETGNEKQPSGLKKFFHSVSRIFSKQYWTDLFENNEDETVVDLNLISWAFFEAGVIEVFGAAITSFFVLSYRGIPFYDSINFQQQRAFDDMPDRDTMFYTKGGQGFTRSELVDILAQFQSCYTLSVCVIQAFNMFACKSRLTYPFGKHIFSNYRNFVGIFLGFALQLFILYCPGVNFVFGTSPNFPFQFIAGPIIAGCALIIYCSIRFFLLKRFNPIKFNPDIEGLMMHPTVRTTRSFIRA
ncbi:calcium ATPase [Neoconidiobolus thromboides FSU 785]|nr:calcium ATPase [Neoconidiobolus thromboides FSU 785]